jgi:hypothetical protein
MENTLEKFLAEKSWDKARLIQELDTLSVVWSPKGFKIVTPMNEEQRRVMGDFKLLMNDLVAYVRG